MTIKNLLNDLRNNEKIKFVFCVDIANNALIERLVECAEYYENIEYIPLIRNHLIQIIDHPKLQFWKIHDALELMLKLDPEFVHNLLDEKGKTLEDFKINNL